MSQRAAFCVYSGKGVSSLRAFLRELFDQITEEMEAADDTEDDEYADKFHEGTPDVEMETGDDHELLNRTYIPPANMTMYHEHPAANGPATTFQLTPVSPADHLGQPAFISSVVVPEQPGATNRLGVMTATPLRIRGFGQQLVVETSASPPPSDAASNRSVQSSNGGFFRTYQEAPSTSRVNGTLTPDLNFAEIGHGRGSGHTTSACSSLLAQPHPRQVVEPLSHFDGIAGPSSQVVAPVVNNSGYLPDLRNGYDVPSVSDQLNPGLSSQWPYVQRELPSPSPSPSPINTDPPSSVQPVLGKSPAEGREADGRGRSVKRTLRNTFAFATNTFSFGRTSNSHEGPHAVDRKH